MRVLVYYPWIYLRSGVERTLIEHAKRSTHKIFFITNHFHPEGSYPEFSEFPVLSLPFKVSVERVFSQVTIAALKIIFTRISNFDYDILLVHCDGLGNLVLFRNHQKPAVCFCHTPLRIAYDPYYINKHCAQKKYRKLIVNILGKIFRKIDSRAFRYYDHIFFNSREVYNRVFRYGLRLLNSSILHPGIDESYSIKSTCREPFFLYAGRIMWTKNIESAIMGFNLAKKRKFIPADMRLVIAGMVDKKSVKYLNHLKTLGGEQGDIYFVSTPSDEELHDLYRRCFAVIFPPFNEDWGIVPLEAMLFGKVVISSNMGGPSESIIHGKTGWLVTPDEIGIAYGLKTCLDNKETLNEMARLCMKRAKDFTWKDFTTQLDNKLENIYLSRQR